MDSMEHAFDESQSQENSHDEMLHKDWMRMKTELYKSGYRDGISKGKDTNLQQHFDEAYQLSFNHGLKIGQLKGIVEGLIKRQGESQEELGRILEIILEEEDAAQRKPFLEGKSFVETLESTKQEWDQTITSIVMRLRKLYPDRVKLLEEQWNM